MKKRLLVLFTILMLMCSCATQSYVLNDRGYARRIDLYGVTDMTKFNQDCNECKQKAQEEYEYAMCKARANAISGATTSFH